MKNIDSLDTNSKQDKLTEKVFIQSIVASVLGILLCAVALCSVTWAWFTAGTTTSKSSIQAAHCVVDVAITESGETDPLVKNTENMQNIEYTFAAGTYKIEMSSKGTASSAYCIIYINDDLNQPYYTEQMSISRENDQSDPMTFNLTFNQETKIKIVTCWGVSTISENERIFANEGSYVINKVNDSFVITKQTQSG